MQRKYEGDVFSDRAKYVSGWSTSTSVRRHAHDSPRRPPRASNELLYAYFDHRTVLPSLYAYHPCEVETKVEDGEDLRTPRGPRWATG